MNFPPLPDPIELSPSTDSERVSLIGGGIPINPWKSLRGGCWLVSYTPNTATKIAYDGTLRIEPTSNGRLASGDLYQRQGHFVAQPPRRSSPFFPKPRPRPPVLVLGAGPDPLKGIPIQPRSQYRYYLRATSLQALSLTSFTLPLEWWRFTTGSNTWANEGIFTSVMTWLTTPAGYPSSTDYAEGDVKSTAGRVVGRLKMGWLSVDYRRAMIEFDTAPGCKVPLDSGLGHTWASVFRNFGWGVSVIADEPNVTLAGVSGGSWTYAQLHEAMLAHRMRINLDVEWHFHFLSVNLLTETDRGVMYDVGATDSNNVPRQGVGIANDWIVPTESRWGTEQGKRFADSKPLFFRTAVHELGHAMGLEHDTVDNGFMNTTPEIADSSTATNAIPNNIKWQYASGGLKGLRHNPDPYVRPGGIPFGSESALKTSATDSDFSLHDLEVTVTPVLAEVPLGAPVRVAVQLKNRGVSPMVVPVDISLKSEHIYGEVSKIDGGVRTFRPLIRCVDTYPEFGDLSPGESISSNLTLLRGGQGALFHSSGLFRITITIKWSAGDDPGYRPTCSGSNTVFILPAANPDHAKIAHSLLSTPDTLLVLVLGQSSERHLVEGARLIKIAVSDPVLGGHFASIEARRLLRRGDTERTRRALQLVQDKRETMICSSAEWTTLQRLFDQNAASNR